MWNLERVLGAIDVVMAGLIGGFNFGWKGVLLVFAAFVGGFLCCSGNYVEYEDDEPEHDSCEGGGYEAWEEE